jgi:hypothetical protein
VSDAAFEFRTQATMTAVMTVATLERRRPRALGPGVIELAETRCWLRGPPAGRRLGAELANLERVKPGLKRVSVGRKQLVIIAR